MQLPGKMGELDFSGWLYGLLSAFIGGGAGAFAAGLSVIMVDPRDFNIYASKFWQVVGSTFVLSGLLPFFSYLHNKPLPEKITTTTVERGPHSAEIITGTGNGQVVEKLSPHETKITTKVVEPAGKESAPTKDV